MLVGQIPVCIAPHQCWACSLESSLPKETAAKSLTLLYSVLHSELKNSHRVRCDQERLICAVPGLIPAGLLIIKELNAHVDFSLFTLNAFNIIWYLLCLLRNALIAAISFFFHHLLILQGFCPRACNFGNTDKMQCYLLLSFHSI